MTVATLHEPQSRAKAPLPYRVFDADSHYYEATDALTRHLPREWRNRGARWATVNGRERLLLGDKLYSFIPNPTFDPIARPGCLHDYFRAETPDGASVKEAMGALEPIGVRPEYRDRDVRLKVMDEQGVGASWMFPTLAVTLEVGFQPDIPACLATLRAFNRWLEEDWGFNYKGRIFAAPVLSFSDPQWLVEELEWCLAQGARLVAVRNGPVYTPTGPRSPAAPEYDPFWARCEEAGIVVAGHSGEDGYDFLGNLWEPDSEYRGFGNTPLRKVVTSQRAVPDFFGTLVCHRLFERFPNLKVASVENGGDWVAPLLLRLKRGWAQNPTWYKSSPIEQFQQHIWVTPFWEDNVEDLKRAIPVDRLLFGSDWPHVEGVEAPLDFLNSLASCSDAEVRRIMRDNVLELTPQAQL
jgi:predicted TIM-barrel fold metal-dependent hydrolase